MTDINSADGINGSTATVSNGQLETIHDSTIKDANAVLAKNKELLGLMQKEKQTKNELLQKIQEIEREKLQAEGKKDELITQLNADLKKTKSEYNQTKAKYAMKAVTSQVAAKARELGCIDTEMLTKAMNLENLQVTIVDDDFNVDEAGLMSALDEVKKTKTYLFNKAGPVINDTTPGTNIAKTSEPDFTKMTTKEIMELAKKMES